MIYVIRGDHGRSKIGVSVDPSARLSQLRTASAFPLSFAAIYAPDCLIDGALRIEQGAHAILAPHRTEGEWFDVEPTATAAAVTVSAMQIGIKLCQVSPDQADQVARVLALPAPAARKPFSHRVEAWAVAIAILIAVIMTFHN